MRRRFGCAARLTGAVLALLALVLAFASDAPATMEKVRANTLGSGISLDAIWQVQQHDRESPHGWFAPRPVSKAGTMPPNLCLPESQDWEPLPDEPLPESMPPGWDLETFLHLASICDSADRNRDRPRIWGPWFEDIRADLSGAAEVVRVTAEVRGGRASSNLPVRVQLACTFCEGEIVEAVIRPITGRWGDQAALDFILPVCHNTSGSGPGGESPYDYSCREVRLALGAGKAVARCHWEIGDFPPPDCGTLSNNTFAFMLSRHRPLEYTPVQERPWPYNWLRLMSRRLGPARLPPYVLGTCKCDWPGWPYTQYALFFAPDAWRNIKDAEGYPPPGESASWPPSDLFPAPSSASCTGNESFSMWDGPQVILWDVRR
jgi:hypothetical protein